MSSPRPRGTEAPAPALLDPERWRALREAGTPDERARAWLPLELAQIPGAICGLVLLRDGPAGDPEVVARFPEEEGPAGGEGLEAAARGCLAAGAPLARPGAGGSPATVALPLLRRGRPVGAVAVEVAGGALEEVLRQLQWGAAWLAPEGGAAEGRLAFALDLVAEALDAGGFDAACRAVAGRIERALGAERASVGLLRRGRVRIAAVSHTAEPGAAMQRVRAVAEAMEEALDQDLGLAVPEPEGRKSPPAVLDAHRALARLAGGAVLTVPLRQGGHAVGALTVEAPPDRHFEAADVELVESAAAFLGPLLALQQRAARPLHRVALDSLRAELGRILGPGHLGRKVALGGTGLLLAVLALVPGELRLAADATLEGAVRRSLVAPFDAYIASAPHRAGDVVAEGEVLLELDARDLELERLKWESQRLQQLRELDHAMASGDRAEVQILRARLEQTEAQLALVQQQLERTRIRAPMAGLIVEGDLSQSLGAAVRRGETLFELAPEGRFRLVLQVDERDVAEVAVGQEGEVVLEALPAEPIPFRVTRVSSVSTAADGRNTFRVEAELLRGHPRLRPGMEGLGRIGAGRRSLLDLVTRGPRQWLRIQAFRWLP